VDEAGRGPLFGRVYAAAVVLPPMLPSTSTSTSTSTFDHTCISSNNQTDWNVFINQVFHVEVQILTIAIMMPVETADIVETERIRTANYGKDWDVGRRRVGVDENGVIIVDVRI
jgi:hypothetical protein